MKKITILYACLLSLNLAGQKKQNPLPHFNVRNGSITWDVEERYGRDDDKNGMIDVHYDQSYTSPYIRVNLKIATSGLKSGDFDIKSFSDLSKIKLERIQWLVNGQSNFQVISRDDSKGEISISLLEENSYLISVSGKVTFKNKFIEFKAREEIFPDDIVILAVGDSYSSGEGNPDKISPGLDTDPVWSDVKNTTNADCQCGHRSTTNWSSLAAYELEKSDPHTSVTYINLASSGARIQHLINTSFIKYETPEKNKILCVHPYSQLDLGLQYLGNRNKIDAIVISAGGNDVGFLQAIWAYQIRNPNLPLLRLDEIERRMKDGKWESSNFNGLVGKPLIDFYLNRWLIVDAVANEINFEDIAGLNNLSDEYYKLHTKINSYNKIKNVFIMQYPDIAQGCDYILDMEQKIGGVNVTMRISEDEINHFKDKLFKPLFWKINQACNDYGWISINGNYHDNSGYCFQEIELYDSNNFGFYKKFISNSINYLDINSNNNSYVRTLDQSIKYQRGVYGSMHPNAFGHLAYAKDLLNKLKSKVLNVPLKIFLGRFNNDSNEDELVIKPDGIYVKIKNNVNSELYENWLNININGLSAHVDGWCVGDFNGDGYDDIMATILNKGLKVFINTRNSQFEETDIWSSASFLNSFWRSGDFNGDGFDDLFTSNGYVCNVCLNSKQYSFNTPNTISSNIKLNENYSISPKLSIHFEDLNNDNRDEVILLEVGAPSKLVVQKFNNNCTSFEVLINESLAYTENFSNVWPLSNNERFKFQLKPIIGNFDNDIIKDIAIIPQYRINTHGILSQVDEKFINTNGKIFVLKNLTLTGLSSPWYSCNTFQANSNKIFEINNMNHFSLANSNQFSGINDIEIKQIGTTWILRSNSQNKFELVPKY